MHWPCRNDDFELTTLESRCLPPSVRLSILGICLPIWLARSLAVFVWVGVSVSVSVSVSGSGAVSVSASVTVTVAVAVAVAVTVAVSVCFRARARAYLYSPAFTAHTHSLSVGSFVCAAYSHEMFFPVSS